MPLGLATAKYSSVAIFVDHRGYRIQRKFLVFFIAFQQYFDVMSDSNSDTVEYGSFSDESDFEGFTEADIQQPVRRAGSASATAGGIGTSGLSSESDDSSGEEVCMLKYVDIYQVLYTTARLNTACSLVIIIRAYRSRVTVTVPARAATHPDLCRIAYATVGRFAIADGLRLLLVGPTSPI